MCSDYDFIKDNFFILSNENLESAEDRLYGYVLIDDNFCVNKSIGNKIIKNECYGSYINIVNSSEDILIQQDFRGFFGIFIYNSGNSFAVSNSLLFLINYLRKQGIKLTLNTNYAKTIIFTWTSLNYTKTIINEITYLPHIYNLKINKRTKLLEKVRKNYNINMIDIDSSAGIKIIDDWHDRWSNLAKSIVSNNSDYKVNISGGFDSRAALSILFPIKSTHINLEQIRFKSNDHPSLRQDLIIASQIAKKLGFQLNATQENPKYIFISSFLSLAISLFSKMTIHNQIYIYDRYLINPFFYTGGNGGEFVRNHWTQPADKFINEFMPPWEDYRYEMMKMFLSCIKEISDDGQLSDTIPNAIYECCRGRNHFGRYNLESFITNYIGIHPLLDPCLKKLKYRKEYDKNLLFSLIYQRYLPEIDDICFDSNKLINSNTLGIAKEINDKFPKCGEKTYNEISFNIAPRMQPSRQSTPPDTLRIIREIFLSDSLKKMICNFFGENIYAMARNELDSDTLHIDEHIIGLIGIYIAYVASNSSYLHNNIDIIEELADIA